MKNTDWKSEIDKYTGLPNALAPEFLFTRIEQKIANLNTSKFSPSFSWAVSAGLVLWFGIQVFIISPNMHSSKKENWVESYELAPNNQLYK